MAKLTTRRTGPVFHLTLKPAKGAPSLVSARRTEERPNGYDTFARRASDTVVLINQHWYRVFTRTKDGSAYVSYGGSPVEIDLDP